MSSGGERRGLRPDDRELSAAVRRAQDGDEAAFALAYRIVQPGLLGYLRGLVADAAPEVAADSWLDITQDLARFNGDGAGFRGWTAAIARHRAMDHLRHQKAGPRSTPLEQDALDPPHEHRAPHRTGRPVSAEYALQLLRGLPRDQAEAILLRVVVGLDAPATARVLGKRPRTVRAAVHRGLKGLASLSGGEEVAPEMPWRLGEST